MGGGGGGRRRAFWTESTTDSPPEVKHGTAPISDLPQVHLSQRLLSQQDETPTLARRQSSIPHFSRSMILFNT